MRVPSAKAPQVCDDELEIVSRQRARRHPDAGLHLLRVRDPLLEVLACIGKRSGADGHAAAYVRELRADPRCGICAANGVAGDTRGLHEQLTPAALLAGGRLDGGLPLIANPHEECVHRLGDDDERHLGVLMAAEFRTLTAIDTGLVGLNPYARHLARNEIALALEIGHPEAVNDVS